MASSTLPGRGTDTVKARLRVPCFVVIVAVAVKSPPARAPSSAGNGTASKTEEEQP